MLEPIWRVYRQYALRYWVWYLAGFLCLYGTNWLSVKIPLELGKGIDLLEQGGASSDVIAAALTIGWMGLGVIVIRTLSRVLIFTPGRYVEHDLRRAVFEHVLNLQKVDRQAFSAGDMVSRTANDITLARALVGFGTMQVVNVAVALGLTGHEMWKLSPKLTLYAAVPIVLGALAMQGGIRAIFTLTRKLQELLADLSEQVLASFQGVGVVKGFVAQPAFEKRFEERSGGLLRAGVRLAMIGGFFQPLMGVAASIALFFLLAVGGPLAIEGDVSVGQIAAFAAYLLYIVPPLRSMGWLISVVQRGRASLERIFGLLDLSVDRPERDKPQALPSGSHGFRIRELDFSYPDDSDAFALQGLSFEFQPGESTGIFGLTGCGKTTLCRLLTRVFNAQPGQIELVGEDGAVDLSAVDLDAYRRRLAVVPQVPFLFTETLAENVRLGSPFDETRLREALQSAAMERDLHQLPDGDQTIVGERGILLSGGQRQRVALARALYRKADLIVLDDVLSAVDHGTENQLVQTLRGVGRGEGHTPPTMIVVSHRVSALAHCDRIIVLDKGRLIDEGHHSELIKRPGLYAEAWKKQSDQATTQEVGA